MRHAAFILATFFLGCADGGHSSNANDAGTDSPIVTDAGFGDACATHCSTDLRQIVDCQGNQQACAGAQQCDVLTGGCADPCQAAADDKSSVGCEYYATPMAMGFPSYGCFVAFVANAWTAPAHISVTFDGDTPDPEAFVKIPQGTGKSLTYTNYNATTGLPPGQVAILFLGGTQGAPPACPFASAEFTEGVFQGGSGLGYSYHITTDVPVVTYEMNPYNDGVTSPCNDMTCWTAISVPGASLLLPVSAWGTNYVAVANDVASSLNIVASRDNTTITILPTATLNSNWQGQLPNMTANTPATFTLNAGQQAELVGGPDFTGSIIESSAPVGLWGGSAVMQAPKGTNYFDHGEQMIPPVNALGNEYVGVMYRSRTGEPAIWRVVGAVDGTQLVYTPAAPPSAPASIARGAAVEFITDIPFVVTSQDTQHPFMLFELMSGSQWTQMKDLGGYGDPDFQLQVPPQQYANDYVFFTDPTYPETNLVVIRRADAQSNFQDVTLDCAGTLGGWQSIGSYQWTRQDLQTGNFESVGGCSNGAHEMKSAAPFGVAVWGWGTPKTSILTTNVSYSYPAGMRINAVNSVVVPPQPN